MAGCTTTTIGGASGDHGLISGFMVNDPLTEGGAQQQLESYMVILGLFDVGFPKYAEVVKGADAQGRKITSISRSFFGIINITTAYAK